MLISFLSSGQVSKLRKQLEKAEQAAAEMESAMTKREDEVAKQVRVWSFEI